MLVINTHYKIEYNLPFIHRAKKGSKRCMHFENFFKKFFHQFIDFSISFIVIGLSQK